MNSRYFYPSLCRISDLAQTEFSVEKLSKQQWQMGDYVLGEICHADGCVRSLELSSGRMIELTEGDQVIGVFGVRAATLEAVGDWREIGDDQCFEMLTPAGLFGKLTSKSLFLPSLMRLKYLGHVIQNAEKRCMSDYISEEIGADFSMPVILIVGTSMSAGKTTSGRVIVRHLKQAGLKVAAIKLTGAARYRDILTVGDAGADYIFDFVDAGLPSSICDEQYFRGVTRQLLSKVELTGADIAVIEVGASPLEPYNGAAAINEIEKNIQFTVLCASDPYAVLGVSSAFKNQPDLVAGAAANTDAAICLVEKLSGIPALNLLDKHSIPQLDRMLTAALDLQY